MPRRHHRLAVAALLASAVVLAGCAVPVSSGPAGSSAAGRSEVQATLGADTQDFRGVNWADPRDNFASDAVVPAGLDVHDPYWTTYRKSAVMIEGFRTVLRANTVRLPINPASVGTPWWNSYRAAIDAATAQGFRVILSYWESDASKDGKIDDVAAYDAMWDTVVQRYRTSSRVYFEPMNEPHGYALAEWVSIASDWLARHDTVPRNRVIISGTGYNDDVTGVGATPALDGTLLSFHLYGYFADYTSTAVWKAGIPTRIGPYGWRTVVDEAGAPMTTGLDYTHHDGVVWTAYFAALTETAREQKMGVVYWPGLRTGDTYSLTTMVSRRRLTVTNASGLAQLQWGWGLSGHEPGS